MFSMAVLPVLLRERSDERDSPLHAKKQFETYPEAIMTLAALPDLWDKGSRCTNGGLLRRIGLQPSR